MTQNLTRVLLIAGLIIPAQANPHEEKAPAPLKQAVQKPRPQLRAPRTLLAQIERNHPELKRSYSIELANVFNDAAKKHHVPAQRIAAIAMQESGYVLDAKQCYKIKKKLRCDSCMMQINDRTAESMGLDQKRLMTDLNYCVEAGAMVLHELRKSHGKSEPDYWTRYNAVSPDKREAYKQLVERFL